MTSSCSLLAGLRESKSGEGVPRFGVPYSGEADFWMAGCTPWETTFLQPCQLGHVDSVWRSYMN